jgi:hypothetical protein
MPASRTTDVIELLRRAVGDPGQLPTAIVSLQTLVWHSDGWSTGLSQKNAEVLADLAYHLDYYEAGAVLRSEDPSFFDEAHALEEIRAVLKQLESDANAG